MGALVATPAFSGSISLKDAGVPLWIFIIIGGMVVLFQLIPAAILFFLWNYHPHHLQAKKSP